MPPVACDIPARCNPVTQGNLSCKEAPGLALNGSGTQNVTTDSENHRVSLPAKMQPSNNSTPERRNSDPGKDSHQANENSRQSDDNRKSTKFKDCKLWTQVVASFGSAMVQLATGAMFSYPGVVLPSLTDPESDDLILSTVQASLFGSMIHVGNLVGALTAGVVMTYLGQRRSILFISPVGMIAWVLIATSPSFGVLLAARFLIGFTTGIFSSNSYNFVVELTHTKVRGRLLALNDLFRQIGFTATMGFGFLNLTWRQQVYLQFPFLILAFVLLYFMHDSPRWLATRNRREDAYKSLVFYRGSRYDVEAELNDICKQLDSNKSKISAMSQLKLMTSKNILPKMLITCFFMTFAHWGGNIVLVTYNVVIFQSANVAVDPYLSGFVSAGIRIFGALTYILIAERFNRKTLFTVPLFLAGSSMASMGIFFYLQLGTDVSRINWLPLTSMCAFSFFTSVYYPVMMLLRGELLPNSVRSLGSGLHYCCMSLGMFSVTLSYPYMVGSLGYHWTFWIYALSSFILVIVVATFIPETKGKTLEAIGDIKMSRRNKSKKETGTP